MNYPVNRPPRVAKSTVAQLAVAVVVALIWGFFALPVEGGAELMRTPEGAGELFGRIIGASLVEAGAVWFVLYFAFVRRQAPRRGPIHFAIIFGSVLVMSFGLVQLYQARADETADQAAVAMASVNAELKKAMGAPETAKVDRTVRAKGAMGELERAMKTSAAVAIEDQQRYLAEVKAAGYPESITPAAIKRDPRLVRAMTTLAEVRRLSARYRQLGETRVVEARARLAALPLDRRQVEAVLAGFDERAGDGSSFRGRIWDMEEAMIGEIEAAMKVLRRSEGRWQVQGANYVFDSAADMNAYNGHVQRATRIAAEQEALRKQEQAKMLQRSGENARLAAEEAERR